MHKSIRENILLLKLKMTRDPAAYGQLYDLYVDRIYRFVYFKVSSEEIAEDITADVFLRAWQYIVENNVDNLSALLYQIARNLVIDHYRKKGREVRLSDTDDEDSTEASPRHGGVSLHGSLLTDIDRSIDAELVKQCLPLLRDEHREIITFRFIEELSIREIAEILEIKEGHVRVQIHRAIKALRIKVKQHQEDDKSQNTNSRHITNHRDANK